MAPDRKSYTGKGKTREQGFKSDLAESHSERAAQLLAKARASSSSKATPPPSLQRRDTKDDVISLPLLIKSLANPQLGNDLIPIKEAIPIAGKLTRAKLNTPDKLSLLNSLLLEEAGISSEVDRHRILVAFGVRRVGSTKDDEKIKAKGALGALSTKSAQPASKKRSRAMDDEALSREYGNINAPVNEPGEGDLIEYIFNEVLEEDTIKDRRAVINRAPIMTAWATIVLERLGFQRREALSLAHCYVHTTSTARGISLGIIPASERQRSVHVIGSNQPHFELMGVKIPLMKIGKRQEWRGISGGQVVGPDNAFNYMKKSMHQTLPVIIGALMLLADSFATPPAAATDADSPEEQTFYDPATGPDVLHANAYQLYTQFRPSTAGEWGKKSTFYCGKALALRRGKEVDLNLWDKLEGGGNEQDAEIEAFERELRSLVKEEEHGNVVKAETIAPVKIKEEG